MTYDRLGRRTSSPTGISDTVAAEAGGGIEPGVQNAARKPQAGRRAAGQLAETRSRATSLRILPVTAFVAALVLTVKVADLWERRDGTLNAVSVGTPAAAQDSLSEATGNAGDLSDRNAPVLLAQAEQAARPEGDVPDKIDPFNLGKSQIELLQSLADRREELEERERALIQREGLLAAAEHRIEQKIVELDEIKAEIETLIIAYDEQEEEQLGGLVKIYETMKPKDAARIFDELDMDVLLEVIERMKASKTALVLAEMTSERAKEVTSRIAERREMPDIN